MKALPEGLTHFVSINKKGNLPKEDDKVAKPNYRFEKRKKELAKIKKKEEKRQNKLAKKNAESKTEHDQPPDEGENT